jgi:RNA polymerase sigma-70 factor (ECF subfamily)
MVLAFGGGPRLQSVFDETWRRKALQGNEAAVKTLLEHVLRPLYGFCLYRVGKNQHWCEEIVQETMLRALRDLSNYDPPRAKNNIFPWLTGMARNEIQRVLQREKAATSLQTLWANMDEELLSLYAKLESEPFDDELLQREETRDLVNATMAQLPDHYRQSLEEKYVLGKSLREMAELWQLSEKAIESQLVRARKAFRATFQALSRHLQTEVC